MTPFRRMSALLCLSLLLTACGGGGGDSSGTEPPPSPPVNTNPDPVAIVASSQQSLLLGETATLDGSPSKPPSGGSASGLSYQWKLTEVPESSVTSLSDATASKTTFVPDKVGKYVATLVVKHGDKTSPGVTSTIDVKLANDAPVAEAGADITAVRGTTVQLDGTASSDPDGDKLSYRWEFNGIPFSSRAELSGAKTSKPTFVPDVVGTYVALLTVYDPEGRRSETDGLTITVTKPDGAANIKPTAVIAYANLVGKPSVEVERGRRFALGYDRSVEPDGDKLTPAWRLVSKPAGSALATLDVSALTGICRFTPDVDGNYVVELVVNDGTVDSDPVQITVVAKLAANTQPMAGARADSETVMIGTTVKVFSNSSDANDDPLTYQWVLSDRPDNSNTVLTNATLQDAQFIPDVPGAYTASLMVTDDRGLTSPFPGSVTVLAKARNNPPVAIPGFRPFDGNHFVSAAPKVIVPNTDFQLSSASYDPDADALYYLWEKVSAPAGSVAELDGSQASYPSPTFTPDLPGAYTFSQVVSDGIVTSERKTITFTVQAENGFTGLRLEDKVFANFDNWRNAWLPYEGSLGGNRNDATPAEVARPFRLTARGGSYTIKDLTVTSTDPAYAGFVVGLTEGQVIADGQTVEFQFWIPALPTNATELPVERGATLTFRIAETGETFSQSWSTSSDPAP